MTQFTFAQYDAFSDKPFGGSQAAVIENAQTIDKATRLKIAREIGLPATAFVGDIDAHQVEVQFMSTVMELPMCGHGTICLMSHLTESGYFPLTDNQPREIELKLPNGNATVEISKVDNQRIQVMLDIKPPSFKNPPDDNHRLVKILGLDHDDLDKQRPLEIAHGDFIHLVVPLAGLHSARKVQPDFAGIVDYCHDHGIETVVVFSTEVEHSENFIHVRDFCPAVGVAESAAAGTTNAALTSYLIRHAMVQPNVDGIIDISAEQGHEINRPSRIRSVAQITSKTPSTSQNEILRLQVGGIATRIIDGQIYL